MIINKNITIEILMSSPFNSGGLTVNFSQNRVEYQQNILVLQPKVLELLVLLCAAQGQTLSKQTLTAALWPETIVGPDSLANSVTRLRKVLGDDAKNPQFIETVQRKGYRWLQEVDLTKHKITNRETVLAFTGVAISAAFIWAIYSTLLTPNVNPSITSAKAAEEITTGGEKFPFPDLHIERLAEGGYEIQVGIDGELTEERKVAMLKEIKRITGEEHSDMIFTIDPIKHDCKQEKGVKGQVVCADKSLKKTNH
ncbi:winged helix-turn-helix domain-containing protein [Colwellia sp. 12G3]|uniref:winged helix-turn-helix domain-containing protein n=1 Tax=Colwellia sp. 12G3 TaxID=2058299 RepID=UPI000C33DDC4|nr:winged helix-turn-helix domain-containing protein [Colwellia sp. 12G3]PKI15870.1 hypothetical protein CXF71_12775 [Colwellia sp. 12G3]